MCNFCYSTPLHLKSLINGMLNVIVIVTAKHLNLALLCIDHQHLFLQHYVAVFIPTSDGIMDLPGHLPSHICIESHSNGNFCPVFYLKVYLCCTEAFRKMLNEFHEASLFFCGNKYVLT